MSFVTQAARTVKYNQSLLRKKSFFHKVGESKAVRKSSSLDLETLQRKSRIIYQRKYRRTIVTRSIIIPFVIASLFLLFWMVISKFNLQTH